MWSYVIKLKKVNVAKICMRYEIITMLTALNNVFA